MFKGPEKACEKDQLIRHAVIRLSKIDKVQNREQFKKECLQEARYLERYGVESGLFFETLKKLRIIKHYPQKYSLEDKNQDIDLVF